MEIKRKKVNIFILTGIMISMFSILACINLSKGVNIESPDYEKVNRMILPEEARTAIINLVENKDYIDLKMSLPNLRTDKIDNLGNNKIAIGKWKCNLKESTFVVSIDADPIFAEYSGVFKLINGKWYAIIEYEVHN